MHRRALPPVLTLLFAATLGGCASAPAPRLSFAELYAREPLPAATPLAPRAEGSAPAPEARRAAAWGQPSLEPATAGALTPPGSAPAGLSARAGSPNVRPRLEWPVEPVAVTSLFGRRLHPVTGALQSHQGLDLAAREGQLVATAGPGTVVRAGWRGGYGLQVEVVHAGGVHTRYGHLSRILVEPGTVLEPGDVVGLAGNTGLSTGPHLHFELWRAGRPLDPLRVLGPAGGALLGAQTREGRRPSGRRPR